MRYAKDITLIAVKSSQMDNGSWSEVLEEKQTFCNPYAIGTSAYMAAQVAGLHADAEVELRSCEYDGQQRAVIDGIEYSVERVLEKGEFTRLTLSKRANNE